VFAGELSPEIVRYADDLVVGFQHRTEAERFLKEFRERLAKFGLELHPDKTRLIEFGRFAARDRKARGRGKTRDLHLLGRYPLLWATPQELHRMADYCRATVLPDCWGDQRWSSLPRQLR
jgi:hypothetical protein